MSSRSSVYSDSSRVYTPDMLLQLASGLSSSPTFSILGSGSSSGLRSNWAFKTESLSAALENFPDISTAVDETPILGLPSAADQHGAAATSTAGVHSNTNGRTDQDDKGEDEDDDEDGFIYGQGDIRSDLDPVLVDQLSKAIHDALSPLPFSPSPPPYHHHSFLPKEEEEEETRTLSSLPPFLVDSLVPSPRRPRAFGTYTTKRIDTFANGYGYPFGVQNPFGVQRSNTRGRTPSVTRPTFTHGNGGRFGSRAQYSHHHTFASASAYGSGNVHGQQRNQTFSRRREYATSKEDSVTSWRKLDDGHKWSWNDDEGGYVVIAV